MFIYYVIIIVLPRCAQCYTLPGYINQISKWINILFTKFSADDNVVRNIFCVVLVFKHIA